MDNFQIIDTDGVLVRCNHCYEEEDGLNVRGQYWQLPWYDNGGIYHPPLDSRMACPDCGRKFHLMIVEDK